MAVTLYEQAESRDLEMARADGSVPINYVALGTDDEAEVYRAVLDTAPTTLYGLVRKHLKVEPKGNGFAFATVTYETGDADDALEPGDPLASPGSAEAIGGAGTGGPGGPGSDSPDTPPGATDPITVAVSATSTGGTAHVLLSKETVAKVKAGGGVAEDAGNAIGLSPEGVEGCDIVVPAVEFSATKKRRTITPTYFRSLVALTGKTNQAAFWTAFAAGELLYLGFDLSGDLQKGWDVTHKFRFSENWASSDPRCTISAPAGLVIPGKKGFEYVWCKFAPTVTGSQLYPYPISAYVERVYDEGDFSVLGLG